MRKEEDPMNVYMTPSMTPEEELDPFPWYKTMRAASPVSYNEQTGMWRVFRYLDVQRVLSEFETFSSQRGSREFRQRASQSPLGSSLISMDPPRHRQLRNLVTQAFTPRTIAQLEPRITAIVDELLGQVEQSGRMDVIDDLAYPLPVIVIAEMLGIPPEERAQFKRWSDAVVTAGGGSAAVNENFRPGNAHMEMGMYFMNVIAQRRASPGNDLISALLAAEIDGERLNDIELLGFCILLLIAGNETTTNLIGNAILCFDEHPEVYDQLRAAPELIPSAIEEALRYRSPVQAMERVALVDVELGGQRIPADARIIAYMGSANRDEDQFSDADRFDIARTLNRHLAFGYGIHFCIGAPLARLEAKIALGAMLKRLCDIQRVPDTQLEPLRSFIVYGVRHLPVTFQPA
jgi:cytochrome P450